MRRSSGARIAASKYSLSLGATRTWPTLVPSDLDARVASAFTSYSPGSVGEKLPRLFTNYRIVEDCRISPTQFPDVKKW